MTIDPLTPFASLADPMYTTVEVTASPPTSGVTSGFVVVTENGVPFALVDVDRLADLVQPLTDPAADLPPLVVVNGAHTLLDLLEGPSVTLLNLPIAAVAVSGQDGIQENGGECRVEGIGGVIPVSVIDQYIVDQSTGRQPLVRGPGWLGGTPDRMAGPPQTGLATIRCRRCGEINENILIYDPDDPPWCKNRSDKHRLVSR